MKLTELTDFLDSYLSIAEIDDVALNGLQVEGNSNVDKIALATDICTETINKAAALRADLLLTHHGLFWGKPLAVTGTHGARIKTLLSNNISLYSVHLPLDLHPEVGNNVELIKILDYTNIEPFGVYHGVSIGYKAARDKAFTYREFLTKLRDSLGVEPVGYKFGPDAIKTIAVISGDGASMIEQLAKTNIDLFLTGEQDHISFHIAKELNVSLVFSGHYATETLGVKSLGALLGKKFGIETVFIDVPTGL
ncbi:Nif3-like dinuclear metal center hexameric protein [candidate division KSB1 bacterium]|nr:Nif3-like dinuclear metal center hexameric protein [candidate division KSB1 bacterium]